MDGACQSLTITIDMSFVSCKNSNVGVGIYIFCMHVLHVLNVLHVLHVLNVLHVLHVLYVLHIVHFSVTSFANNICWLVAQVWLAYLCS